MFKCFCGKPSVEIDTWFQWYPCEEHLNLTPNEYQIQVRLEELKKLKKEAEDEQEIRHRKG